MKGRSRHHTLLIAAVSAVAVALAAPAASSAAVTMGQVNPVTPAGGGNCGPGEVFTQSRSAGVVVDTAPFSGVITSWSTRATDTAGQQAQLKTISQVGNPGAVTYTVHNSSNLESLTSSSLNTFAAQVPIQAGQRIGYFFPTGAPGSQACDYDGVQNANETAAGPTSGQPNSTFTNLDGSSQKLINLSAKLEADADHDGFGDETQDRCPGVAGSNGGCTSAGTGSGSDKTKPTISGLSFSATTFKAAKSGSAFTSRKRKKVPTGTKVSFNLSEASAVKFTVQRKTKGRKVHGKCKTKTHANRKKKSCTLYKSVRGSFTVSGKAGKNTFTFRGRIGGKALRRGSYRLSGTATDPAKNASVPKLKSFKIVR
jgi:hypothetical protein